MNKKIVLKFGTGVLMSGTNKLNDDVFDEIAKQIIEIKRKNFGVVVVSSGAIQAGKDVLNNYNLKKVIKDLNKKEIAGIGSRHLFNKWGQSFNKYNFEVCEMLVTHANWHNNNERENIRKGIEDCFSLPIIPIINENDIVSDEEIRWMEEGISENDKLARMIAILIKSDIIMFLTASNGVYDNNKKTILKQIDINNLPNIFGKSNSGSGGIEAKIKEAIQCYKGGIKDVVISGIKNNSIINFVNGKDLGTRIIKLD